MMNQFVLATYENEHINFRIERNQGESKFFYLDHEGKETGNLKNCISTEFKKKFPTEAELRFELLFRSANQFYEKNGINFYVIKLESKMDYDLIKEEILDKLTHGIPFNHNEKIKLFENKIIRINGIRLMNVKMLVLNSTGLQLYSDPNSSISDFVSIKKISSFKIDDEDIKVRYVLNNDEYHYDLFISRSINELLNTFSSETDKPLLDKDKAIQWFKDLGYNLNVFEEDNDDLDYHYEGIFEIPSFDDDTVNDKLYEAHKLEVEVDNLLKHF